MAGASPTGKDTERLMSSLPPSERDALLAALIAERYDHSWWTQKRRREERRIIDDSDVTIARRRRQLAEEFAHDDERGVC